MSSQKSGEGPQESIAEVPGVRNSLRTGASVAQQGFATGPQARSGVAVYRSTPVAGPALGAQPARAKVGPEGRLAITASHRGYRARRVSSARHQIADPAQVSSEIVRSCGNIRESDPLLMLGVLKQP